MTVLILEPHADDCALFCAFTAIREHAHVVTVLRGDAQAHLQGRPVTADQRQAESEAAMSILGCAWEQLPFSDVDPAWDAVDQALHDLDRRLQPKQVYAPTFARDGHSQHNAVAELADRVYGDRVVHYLTYANNGTRHQCRSTNGRPVAYEPAWVGLKLRALACYESQIGLESTNHHFVAGLREYYAS